MVELCMKETHGMKEATAVKAHMEERAADVLRTWRSVRRRSTWRSMCEGSTRGGGTHGGACVAEAHVVKAQVVELCLRMPCWYVSASGIHTRCLWQHLSPFLCN